MVSLPQPVEQISESVPCKKGLPLLSRRDEEVGQRTNTYHRTLEPMPTAISIRSAVHFSLKHPRARQRLRDELAAAGVTKESYRACKGVPYLEPVARKALPMLAGVPLSPERYVPDTARAASSCRGGLSWV